MIRSLVITLPELSQEKRHPIFTKVINVQPFYTLETLSNKTKGLLKESLAT